MKAISTVFLLLLAAHSAFAQIDEARDAIDRGDAAARLNGPVARRGFYRLTS